MIEKKTMVGLLQLRYPLQLLLVHLLKPQAPFQPADTVETGGGVESVRRVIDGHLLVAGGEGVKIALGESFVSVRGDAGRAVGGGKLQEDALTGGVAEEIHGIVKGVSMKIFVNLVCANFLDVREGLRIMAGEGIFFVEISAGHEHETADTRFNAGEDGAHVSVPTVADIGDAFGINVTAETKQINGAAEVDHLVHGGVTLLAGSGERIFFYWTKIVAGLRRVNQQREHAGMRERESFLKELIFVGEWRALLEPVSPDDGGKRTFTVRDNQIRRHTVAVGAGIIELDEHGVVTLLNVGFTLLQAGFGVVVEAREQVRVGWLGNAG